MWTCCKSKCTCSKAFHITLQLGNAKKRNLFIYVLAEEERKQYDRYTEVLNVNKSMPSVPMVRADQWAITQHLLTGCVGQTLTQDHVYRFIAN